MASHLRTLNEKPFPKELSPVDLIGLLADAEWISRENKKLGTRLRAARMRQNACLEDVDFNHARGLSRPQVQELASSRWVTQAQNVLLTGPTGVGKSYLACALGQKACRDGYSVFYRRTSRLFDELAQARADGSYPQLMRRIAKTQVLILDDFGLEPLGAHERKELLEILEDRYRLGATVVTSQLEPKDWHAIIGEATVADAILDRLVHDAHRVKLSGETIRKVDRKLTEKAKTAK